MSTIVNDLISYLQAGEALAANDAIYIDSADGKAYKFDVTDDTQTFAGIAKESAALDDFVRVAQSGRVKGFSGLTAGAFVYASTTTPGGFQLVEPIASQKIILGIAKSATELTINGGLGIKPGGDGAGGGGLDVYYTEDMEGLADVSSFETGNNAAFQGGGTIQGTLTLEETDEISGTKSLSYTQASGSLNDYFASETIDVDFKQQNNDSGMTFYFTYDGNDDDGKFVVYDETNDEELTSGVELVKEESTARRYALSFYVPNTCTQIRWGYQVLVENIGAELIVDDVEITSNPFVFGSIEEENEFSVNVENDGTITIGTRAPDYQWWDSITRNSVGDVTIDYTSLGLTEIPSYDALLKTIANRRTIIVVSESATSVTLQTYNTGGGALTDEDFSFSLRKHGADYNQPQEHVITPAKSTLSNETDYTPTAQGFGASPTLTDFKYTIIGDKMLISGLLTSDTPTAVEAQIGLPSGYTIKSSQPRKVVGSHYRGGTAVSSKGGVVLATGGDSFVNFSDFNVYSGSGSNYYSPANGDDVVINSGEVFSFEALVSIEELDADATFLAAIPTPKTAYIKDVKPSGTNGGTFTSGAWQTRDLNTLEGDTGFVSLSANAFTLQPGKYEIEASAPAFSVDFHKSKLRNITDSADELIGSSDESVQTDTKANTKSVIIGQLVLTDSKTFEVQHRCSSTQASVGFGRPTSFGVDEIYTQVKITKVG